MGFATEITAAAAAGQLVRMERGAIETGRLAGHVVAAGTGHFGVDIADGSTGWISPAIMKKRCCGPPGRPG